MLRTAAAMACVCFAVPVFAQSASTPGMIETTTHFGFAVEDRSTTGFKDVGGSLVYLDAMHPVSEELAVGVRTIGEGAHGAAGSQYYRLGAGPAAAIKVNDSWLLDLSMGRFQETAMDHAGGALYHSAGGFAQLGYERVWSFGPRAEGALGGFAGLHQGGMSGPPGTSQVAAVHLNQGLEHGLEMALRVAL